MSKLIYNLKLNINKVLRRLSEVRHTVAGNVLFGVLFAGAGLMQSNTTLVVGGVALMLLSTAVLVATFRVAPVLEGQVLVEQQPQLTDVRAHAPHTKELPQPA